MTKIVYNTCFGGFSLSEKAILRYGELKGLTVYPVETRDGFLTAYWTIPEKERKGDYPERDQGIFDRDIPRDDPLLVQVVEELGAEAAGRFAALAIRELAPGTKYRIEEYDGAESVVTIDEYYWSIA